jgi:Ion transport protein
MIDVLDVVNYLFLSVYVVEILLKLLAFGLSFFRDSWNSFDLVIISLTCISLVVTIVDYNINDLNSSSRATYKVAVLAIRSVKIFRLAKLVPQFKYLRMIFNTFLITLPALFNVGSLLVLILFIYAILGMQFFSFVKYGQGITSDSHF